MTPLGVLVIKSFSSSLHRLILRFYVSYEPVIHLIHSSLSSRSTSASELLGARTGYSSTRTLYLSALLILLSYFTPICHFANLKFITPLINHFLELFTQVILSRLPPCLPTTNVPLSPTMMTSKARSLR